MRCVLATSVPPTARPTVAIDVTPLLGRARYRGRGRRDRRRAPRARSRPDLVPYTLSTARASPRATRFRPIRASCRSRRAPAPLVGPRRRPRIDRWLEPARVLHATNYLAPPSRPPTVVSVYDCSFVRYPELCTPEVRAVRSARSGGRWPRRDLAHRIRIRRRRDRGDLRPRPAAAGRLVVIPLGVPPSATSRRCRPSSTTPSATPRSSSRSAPSNRARTLPISSVRSGCSRHATRSPARHRRPRRAGAARDRRRGRAPPGRHRGRGSCSRARSPTRAAGHCSENAPRCSRIRRSTKASDSRCSRR